jgi:hypothetical protein
MTKDLVNQTMLERTSPLGRLVLASSSRG